MKKLCLILIALASIPVFADGPAVPEKKNMLPRGERRKSQHGFRKSHGIWMAFNDLSDGERQAMLKLQREDPEKFKAEMIKKSEEYFKAEKARREELRTLVNEFRNAKDDAKEELKKKISEMVRQNFKRRLRRSRMQLEELQKRAEKLEQELDKREKAEDKIVEAVVENIISGKRPEHPKGLRRSSRPRVAPLLAE